MREQIASLALLASVLSISPMVGCAYQIEEIKMHKPTLDENFNLKEYVRYHYENSYLKWEVNEEGLPAEEAKRREAASLFPTREAIIQSIETDFRTRFPEGTSVDEFIANMYAAGATHCKFDDFEKYRGTSHTLRYYCYFELLHPIAFSQKVFDRDLIHKEIILNERNWRDVDDFLRWQEEARYTLYWEFSGVLLGEEGNQIGRIRFSMSYS